jgi:hypothetical protein
MNFLLTKKKPNPESEPMTDPNVIRISDSSTAYAYVNLWKKTEVKNLVKSSLYVWSLQKKSYVTDLCVVWKWEQVGEHRYIPTKILWK